MLDSILPLFSDPAAWADETYGQPAGTFEPVLDDGGFTVACRAVA